MRLVATLVAINLKRRIFSMMQKRLNPAFSMLELIFVITILGIVSSIGSEIIAKVYGGYILQRAEHRATLKTELAATQIANRLASAIPGTVIRRLTPTGATEGINSSVLLDPTGKNYTVLQWVGADTDSFSATSTPGWSGFCDVENPSTTATNIETPGSDLTATTSVVTNLSGAAPANDALSLYFPYDPTPYAATIADGDTITLGGAGASHIIEHYKLAWSSYALVVTNGDLFLHYNFTPNPAAVIPTVATKISLLMKNISTFKFKGAGRTIRFKICKEEAINEDVNITSCKEKAVF